MKKEQSSIEWLIEELTRFGFNFKLYKSEIEQAKQIHKKEIIEAHLDGQYCNVKGEESERYGEQYYTEKYSTE